MKKRNIGKRICIGIGVILVLLVVLYILFVNFIQKKAELLEQEFSHIEEVSQRETIDYDSVYYYTNRTVLDGTFGEIEKATKNYIRDVYQEVEGLDAIINSSDFQNLLTVPVILEDGPLFVESQAYVEQTRKDLEKKKEAMIALLEEDKIMEYYSDVHGIFSDLIREELKASVLSDFQSTKEEIENMMAMLDDYLVLISNTMSFLTENKDSWELEGEYISFATDELYNTYEAFITRINDLSYRLNSI